uniref:Mitochondrial carrier protein n=1 Tax=Guillardia theta TaxID=55529 RepID=A0A7S4PML0_GUITH|mmetsp:Transcript_6687/g.23555  ORF Transcript_6687/g.23555 Transcript_6687/m.23555 type:complete len:360 (+) Transcript_6687:147-1226(+)
MSLPTSRSCHIPMLRDLLLLTLAANAIASHSTSVAKMQPSSLARDRRMMPNGLESNTVGDANTSPFIEGLKNSLASGLASAAGKTLLHPFDVIKTIEQRSHEKLGVWEAGRRVVKESGFCSLFTRGLDVTLIGSVPSTAVYFGVYQFLKRKFTQQLGLEYKLTAVALSASTANFIAAFFRVPTEIVKQRVQAGMYPDATSALKLIFADGGFLAFFELRSVMVQVFRDIPYAVVMLLTYEILHSLFRTNVFETEAKQGRGDDSNLAAKTATASVKGLWIGATAGALGALVTTPLDVVKTRWLVDRKQYRGLVDVIVRTWLHEGPAAFFKGAVPRVAQKIPSSSIFFLLYELFRTIFGVKR